MASTQTLLTDTFRARQKEATRHGKIEINRIKGELLKAARSTDRDFLQICAAIEKTGEGMVDDWAARCEDAGHQSYNRLAVRKTAHELIESFIVEAKTWRRIPSAFHGHHTQNLLMDEELDRARDRLGDRFDDRQNRLALKPKKRWNELNAMTWAIVLLVIGGIITGVIGYTNFAAQTVTKPLYEPNATPSPRPN